VGAAACVAVAFRAIAGIIAAFGARLFGDLQPTGYRRRFCFAFFRSLFSRERRVSVVQARANQICALAPARGGVSHSGTCDNLS